MIFPDDLSSETELELVDAFENPVMNIYGYAAKVIGANSALAEVQHFFPMAPAVRATNKCRVFSIEARRGRVEHACPAFPLIHQVGVLDKNPSIKCRV